jgi:hypothetical protein
MADEEIGDEIWTRSEPAEKRVVASDRPALRDKTKELGVFTTGLGIIIAAILILIAMTSLATFQPLKFSILLTPSLLLVVAGICVLVSRSECKDRTQGLQVFGHMGNSFRREGKGGMSVANAGFAFPPRRAGALQHSSRRFTSAIFCQQ